MPGTIRIQANSQTLAVNFTRPDGSAALVFSNYGMSTPITLPATISADTSFYLPAPETYVISVKSNGSEIASDHGTALTQVLPEGRVLVIAPTIDPLERQTVDGGAFPSRRGGTSAASAPLPFYNVVDYGADPTGVSDSRPATLAAVTAAVAAIAAGAAGATVLFPPGVFAHTTGVSAVTDGTTYTHLGVPLPVNLAGKLRIVGSGRGLTTLQLSDACRNLFWINKQADYDTFRNVTFEDFTLDNNNAVGKCHILCGNFPDNGRVLKLNFSALHHRRVDIINVPTDATQATSQKTGVWYECHRTTVSQLTAVDVLAEDFTQDGGDGLFICATAQGSPAIAANCYYDRIYVRRWRHTTPAKTATNGQNSVGICYAGTGGDFAVEDGYSQNISDDAIEIGAMQSGVVRRIRIDNPWLMGIYFRVSQDCPDPNTARIYVEDITVTCSSALFSGGAAGRGAQGAPVRWAADNNGRQGEFVISGLTHKVDGQKYSNLTDATHGKRYLSMQPGEGNARRVVIRNFQMYLSNFVFDAVVDDTMQIIWVSPWEAIWPDNTFTCDITDAEFTIAGLAGDGVTSNVLRFDLVLVDRLHPRCFIRHVTADHAGGSYAQLQVANVNACRTAGGNGPRQVLIDGVRTMKPLPFPVTQQSYNVRVLGSNNIDRLTIRNIGDQNLVGASSQNHAVEVSGAGATTLLGLNIDSSPWVTKTANYTLTASNARALSNGTTLTHTLPNANAAPASMSFQVRNIHASSAATIGATGGTINGSATYALAAGSAASFVSDGTNWYTV